MCVRRRLIGAVLAPLASVAALGCGNEEPPGPAPEPASSPPLEAPPAGSVLRLGGELEGVAADPRTGLAAVIVRKRSASELALVNVDRWRIDRRVPLPAGGRHLELARPGGPILVPAEGADELATVTVPTGAIDAIPVGDFPHDVARVGDRIFVGDEFADTLSVVEEGRVVETVPSPGQPGGVAAAEGVVAVVAVGARMLLTYDARTLEPLPELSAGAGPTHVVADGRRAFVVDTAGDAVLTFGLTPEPTLLATTTAAGTPYGIAIDPRRGRLWLTLTARNQAAEYAITRNGLRLVEHYPTVRQPNTIAVDLRTGDALVAGRSAGGPLQRIPARR